MLIGPAPMGFDERPDVPARVKRWPDRSRCYKCRCYLGFVVVDRLYCGYKCAGREFPAPEPTIRRRPGKHVPRQCKLLGGRRFKRRYFTKEMAEEAMVTRGEPGLSVYLCDYCNYFHMGHPPLAEMERQEAEARLQREESREARREARRAAKEWARRTRKRQMAKRQEKEEFFQEINVKLSSREQYRRNIVQRRRMRRKNGGKVKI